MLGSQNFFTLPRIFLTPHFFSFNILNKKMDLENEIKKLKSQQFRIIFLLEEIINRLDKNQTHGLTEKIKLAQEKFKNENII